MIVQREERRERKDEVEENLKDQVFKGDQIGEKNGEGNK